MSDFYRTFARMNTEKWSKNIIIADADYIDKVAFDLTVNFERMIGRQIPKADMAHWIDCVALDGGLRPGEHETQVVLIHDKETAAMKNFEPSDYKSQLNGVAFSDQLGEFTLSAYPVEPMTTKADFMADVLQTVCWQKEVRRVMVIADEAYYNNVRNVLNRVDDDTKRITVFTMQPLAGGPFRQEILGYSLMAALGIESAELSGMS